LPLRDETGPLRIGLAHGPDQLAWAQSLEIDLLLVGHTHGGQIRIPPLGAIFSPTADGVKYVSGVFHLPPTILHVSRGISSQIPLRWNCRPEVAMLELRTRN
jgi:predicted MPP superfamily phosphohydrolase